MRSFPCSVVSRRRRVSATRRAFSFLNHQCVFVFPVEIKKISIIQRHVKSWLFHRQKEDLRHVSAFLKKQLHEEKDSSLEDNNPG